MSGLLDALRKIQTVDAELYRLRRAQRDKPLELERAKQAFAEQQRAQQQAEAALKALQLRHRERDGELATREGTIKKLQGQLFQVKTNKEYTAMQHEIEQSKADISVLEEQILALLDQIEHAKQAVASEQARLSKDHEAFRKEQDAVEQELAEIAQRIQVLERQREELTPAVDREPLAQYERILKSRDGVAMAPLSNESCSACNMVQPPQVISEAHLMTKLVSCNSCHRILYVDESDL